MSEFYIEPTSKARICVLSAWLIQNYHRLFCSYENSSCLFIRLFWDFDSINHAWVSKLAMTHRLSHLLLLLSFGAICHMDLQNKRTYLAS